MPKITKTSRYNRFHKPYYVKNSYDIFSFNGSLKSYNNSNLFFTNFVKSRENESYKKLEQYLENIKYNDFSFLEDDFSPLDEVKYTEPAAKRLLEIINKGYNYNYDSGDLKDIFEIKNKEKKKFHFFIHKDNNTLNVIMIDFFHLGLNAYLNLPNGSKKLIKNEEIYNKEKNNKWDLNNLIK